MIRRFWIPIVLFACIAGLSVPASRAQGPKPHRVDLQWTAPADFVLTDGYNVYRGTISGGPYTRVNVALVTDVVFSDTTALANTTYFYVVTHANATNESVFSNEVKAVVPKDLGAPLALTVKGVV